MDEMKHPPGPWAILLNVNFPGEFPIIAGTPEGYTSICDLYNCDEEVAEEIIRDHNCHDDLLEACKELREVLAAAIRAMEDGATIDRFGQELKDIGVAHGSGLRAQAAIAKAEGTVETLESQMQDTLYAMVNFDHAQRMKEKP